MKQYIIKDRNDETVTVNTDKDKASDDARRLRPNEVLVGVIMEKVDGVDTEVGGFMVSQIPAGMPL